MHTVVDTPIGVNQQSVKGITASLPVDVQIPARQNVRQKTSRQTRKPMCAYCKEAK